MIGEIVKLRRALHHYPDLSGQEGATADRIKDFILEHHPTRMIEELGGHGLAAIYEFGAEGPTIVIRCELDALPIFEPNPIEHRSVYAGVSHKCGHDGHMAMVAGLIFWIREQSFSSGKIVLLFQPEEETGKGAFKVFQDERFTNLQPDFVFALHNLPGEPMHTVITRAGTFSASVQSLIIRLTGKKAHASEPEKGINPAIALAEIVARFAALGNDDPKSVDFRVITPIYISMGEPSYGIAPERGEVHYTVRTWNEAKMKVLEQELLDIVAEVCAAQRLSVDTEWLEYFPPTTNDAECCRIIEQVAQANGYLLKEQSDPLRFGEDFGWFSRSFRSAIFGLGAGVDTPALHHADYDFPDVLLETGMNMFKGIISRLMQ